MNAGHRAAALLSVTLSICLAGGCKKESPQPTPQPVQTVTATRPATPESPPPSATVEAPRAAPLPAPTRFRPDVPQELPTSLPSGLVENPEIPKPVFPGMGKDVLKVFNGAYIAALQSPNDPAKIGDLGMLFYRVGSAGDSVRCFERSVKADPKAFRWKYYLGLAYEAAFDPDGAIRAFKEAEQIDSAYPGVYLHLGDMMVQKKDPAARGNYERALKLTPNDARIYYGLAQCDLADNKPDAAMSNLKKATEFSPRFTDAQRALAKRYDAIGDKKQADICRAIADQGGPPPVIQDPLYLDLLTRLAKPEGILSITNQLTGLGQAPQAIEILRRAIEISPREWDLHLQLGMILAAQSRPEEAAKEFRAVLMADPSRPNVRAALAKALIDTHQFKQAEQYFKEEIEKQGDDVNAYGQYADFLLRVGKADEAMNLYEKLVKLQPDQPMNELGYVLSLICQKKIDAAINRWQALHRRGRGDRDLTDAFVNQACMLMVEQAEPDPEGFRKQCLVPSLMEQFADKLQDTGQSGDARKVRIYVETVARNAEALIDHGDVAPAIRLLQLAMPTDRGGVLRDAMRLAYMTLRTRSKNAAENFMRESLNHAGESADLAMTLSWILSTTEEAGVRDGAQAVKLAELACEKTHRQNPEALDALAAAYAEAGRYDDAVKAEEAALATAPKEGCVELAKTRYQDRLAQYQTRKPYHARR